MKHGDTGPDLLGKLHGGKCPGHESLIGEAPLGSVDGIDDDVVEEDEGCQVIQTVHRGEEVLELVGEGKLDRDSLEAGEVLLNVRETDISADGEFHGGQLYQLFC